MSDTYTYGTTPEAAIRAAFDRECPDGFTITARGIDDVTLSCAILAMASGRLTSS